MGARSTTIFLILIFLTALAQAQEWVEGYQNTRSLGMGGAQIAVSSDETALFRNPANLGSIRQFYGTAFDPELEGSTNFVSHITGGSLGKAFDIEEISRVMGQNPNQYYHARLQVSPSLVTRNFGFGLLYRNQLHAEVEATGTSMDTFYQNDIGAVMGANVRLFDGRIKLGANAKAVNRIEVINSALPTAGPFTMDTIASEGTGISYDAGLMIQLPWAYLPTLTGVVRDIGDTKYDMKDGVRMRTATRPATVLQSVDAALAFFPIHANQFRSVWTIEMSDVTNSRVDEFQKKRVHFGGEFNWRDVMFVRLGVNQGYWTAGFEIASEKVTWQIAAYGEEIGTETAPREDRRLNTKFTVRF